MAEKTKMPGWLSYSLIFGAPLVAAVIAWGLVLANIPLSAVSSAAIQAGAWGTAGVAACGSAAGAALVPATRWQRAALAAGFALFGIGEFLAAVVVMGIVRMVLVEPF